MYKGNSVCLFFVHHKQPHFQQISTKFGVWHLYTQRMVVGVESDF